MSNLHGEAELRIELNDTDDEPLLPIEKKLVGWSLGIGVGLLIVLVLLNRYLPVA